jgi:16S rRNA (cytosine1402-N4)-methyltransferase
MHIPVLKKEVLDFLNPDPGENFIDCTAGLGGHFSEILKRNGPDGKVLGIERDSELFRELNEKFIGEKRAVLVNDSYANIKKIAENNNFTNICGILMDLGFSSWHIDESNRGFSFLKDEPLDMRYGEKIRISNSEFRNIPTAGEIVNNWNVEKLEKIFKEYGEEKFARKIAERIEEERKIKSIISTFQLVEIIKKSIPIRFHQQGIHLATRVFQALRIAVNEELDNLKIVLPQILNILKPKGKIAIISFHSLEDRIVKNFFKDMEKAGILKISTKKPITPSDEEIKNNIRSRSAKLRLATKI